jgi:nicotinate-nucleotide adenylyltransferase
VRLGILGGTFDPPHIGHLLVASDAVEALELDRLLFVPAGVQPFKIGVVEASGAQRLAMLELLVNGDPRFAVDPIEIDRTGLSYTVDTLAALARRHPASTRYLLIGEDLVGQIGSWRDAARIADLAEIVILARPGAAAASGADGSATLPMRRLDTRRIEISSSEIRARVHAGKSIHGFVPDAVAGFIESAGLYR